MPNICISVKNKIAVHTDRQWYVCGNSDYTAVFEFDHEWDEYETKTARFRYNQSHEDVVFKGNVAQIPVITNTNEFEVGVFAGDLHTTTPAMVLCEKSILCGDGTPVDPTPSVYDQIMEFLNNMKETDPTVPDWAKAETKPTYTAEEVGAIGNDELPIAIDKALAQAKASGEFDGAPGKDGKDGALGAWYVTVTQTAVGSVNATADKTPQEVLEAYQAGYVVYARVNFAHQEPYILPLEAAQGSNAEDILLGFAATGQAGASGAAMTIGVISFFNLWQVWSTELAKKTDIPDIPSALPNPNALIIKVGDATTTYDGSAAKTVEIADGSEVSY